MKIIKRKTPVQTRRQRFKHEQSTLPTAFSYHARRSDQSTENTGRKIQREALQAASKKIGNFWVRRFGALILLIVLVFCTVNLLTISANPKIIILSSTNSQPFLGSTETYQQAASKLFANTVWNHNKITVDTASISAQLIAEFPELSSVSITLPLVAHRPLVYVQATEPAVILHAVNGSFVIDNRGKALLSTDTVTNIASLDLPVVTDQSGLQVSLNHEVLTSDDISFIQTVVTELAARHLSASSLTLPAGTNELDVSITGQPYFVKFNLENNDARQQTGTFLAVETRLESESITPTKYIDVRVDGRAYYE